MNAEQLWDTTIHLEFRRLDKITIADVQEADRLFRVLMGEDVPSRKHFILNYAKNINNLDI